MILVKETSVLEGEELDGQYNTESIESENILALLKMGKISTEVKGPRGETARGSVKS